jgi:GTP cyclohydrolase II
MEDEMADFCKVETSEIENYNQYIATSLQEASRAKLIIKHSIDAEIVCYRAGSKDHYAIIVGKLTDSPLVRIHSSCFTGDLIESLQCDCHDQLHTAIDKMHKAGSGIVLYMMQEGRGIGLVNKIRAYAKKQEGLDTVDANRILGFDDDARLFDPAVKILNLLGVSKLKLLTNNPRKAKALQNNNIDVIECVPHIIESNIHNEKYLKTKFDKLGHTHNHSA